MSNTVYLYVIADIGYIVTIVVLTLGLLLLNLTMLEIARRQEYCNDKGYWVKTDITGRKIGLAIDKTTGEPVRCDFKIEK